MNKKIIYYDAKNSDNKITCIANDNNIRCYSYYKNDVIRKTLFNKESFIEFLRSTEVKRKYITQIEKEW